MGVVLLSLLFAGLWFVLFRIWTHHPFLSIKLDRFLRWLVWLGVLVGGVLWGIALGVGLGRLLGLRLGYERKEMGKLNLRVHDSIARAQHRRRQRLLRSKEHQHVPDTAISRAQPPGEPQATDASLSLTDSTDGADHLTVSMTEEVTEDQVPASR